MKRIAVAILLISGYCCAQTTDEFTPASTNVWVSGRSFLGIGPNHGHRHRLRYAHGGRIRVSVLEGFVCHGIRLAGLRHFFAGSLADEQKSQLMDGERSRIVREGLDDPLSLPQRFQVIAILWISFHQLFEKLLGRHRAFASKFRTMQIGFNSPQIEQRLGAIQGIRQRIRIAES